MLPGRHPGTQLGSTSNSSSSSANASASANEKPASFPLTSRFSDFNYFFWLEGSTRLQEGEEEEEEEENGRFRGRGGLRERSKR